MVLEQLPPPVWVDTPEKYQKMIAELQGQPMLAVDTESNSLYAYHERVCLIQLSTPKRDYLVDPFPLGAMPELGKLFADPKVLKVFHAGDYDLACLKRDYGWDFRNLFDTMLAATALNEPNLGLAGMLEKYLGIKLEKKYQRANWGTRPILPEMQAYAQADSHFLLQLREALLPKLEASGRLEMVLEDSTALAYETPALKTPEEDLWRVKGVQALNPKALSLLYHLNHLREALAEEQDKPPFKIMGDQALVEIAQTQPRYIQELTLLPSLPQPVLRRYGSRIMTAVADWRKKPAQVKKRRLPRLSEAELKRRDKLMEWRKNAGVKEGVPSNAIMSKELVGKLAAQEIKSLDELKTLMRHYPQRYARYAQEILALNRKES